jgi:nucleotidyltransferase substrate binding protein (TIGR01987 family)
MADAVAHLVNLQRALSELEDFAAMPVSNRRDKAGLIQAFEFTFELFWKTFQKLAPDAGLQALSPREALLAGVALRLVAVAEQGSWSRMLRDRNLSSHTYNAELADEIVDRLLSEYLSCFRASRSRIRERFASPAG